MNIVYFIDHLRCEGTQTFLLRLASGLSSRGHKQFVICLNDVYEPELFRNLAGICEQVIVIGRSSLLCGFGLWKIWRFLCHQRADVAVTLLFYSDIIGRTLAHFAGVPRIISSIRARNIIYKPWQKALARFTNRWTDVVVLNSERFRDFAISEEGVDPEKIVVIPNGIDPGPYTHPVDREQVRNSLGIPAEAILIGSIGRLDPQKGFDLLISAIAAIGNPRIHLALVGEGAEEEPLKRQSQQFGLAERVHFLGFRRDIPQLLKSFDIYVQPSRFEGMPNALLEAMAASCPAVASAVDGNLDLIENGKTGWLFLPENLTMLVQSLQFALEQPGDAKQIGETARNRIFTSFNLDKMVDLWETILTSENKKKPQVGI